MPRQSSPSTYWSDWQTLPGWAPSPAILAETLDGGQAFRWSGADGLWTGQWAHQVVQVQSDPAGLAWRAPRGHEADTAPALRRYFALDTNWTAHMDALPWRSDPHLALCLRVYPELRILRQPFGETLLGFLCSATKQIVQIKQMLALLAERHGAEPTSRSTLDPQRSTSSVHALPTWEALAEIPEAPLRACQLGFRAGYIRATACFLARHPGWLDETERLPYPEAKARLMELPGVGAKVADCVLLFGAGRLEAFPVDTWILKALARRYGLDGWKPGHVAQFGRAHFGPHAGLAQQYLFAWERTHGSR